MKKVIFVIAILIGLAGTTAAQNPSDKMKSEKMKKEMKMKDGVMMMDNKVMICKDNKCTPLTKMYTFSDGSKISMNGTVTKTDGKTMKLKNGYEMDMSGKMAMIPHGEKGHACGPDCPMYKKM
jgi:hypothetical protein